MRRVETEARKDVRGDLAAFLRRGRGDRMHRAEIRRQPAEHSQLAIDLSDRARLACRVAREGRMDRLPAARHGVGRVFDQKAMQEGRAAARQAGDEDRLLDRWWRRAAGFLGGPESQEIFEKAKRIPAQRKAAESAERGLVFAG